MSSNLSTPTLPPLVRVHKALLLLHPCATLWYLCWAFDQHKQGWVILTPDRWGLLSESRSTIYRWLREGRELGFFQRYWWQGNTLKIRLGGRDAVCEKSGIENWGVAAEITLEELLEGGRRQIASAIATQDLQQKSHYAARQQLNQLERKCFDIPTAHQLLGDSQTSPNFACGGIRGVVHIGDEKLFVGRSFIPFGVSQQKICDALNSEPTSCGISRWTLRRHLDQLGVKKRQLVQAKPEYREVRDRARQGAVKWTVKGDGGITFSQTEEPDVIQFFERNGRSSAEREGGHKIHQERFFRYFGAIWLYRCNLYNLDYDLTSMKHTRWLRKRRLKRKKSAGAVENSIGDRTPQTPQEEVMLQPPEEGGGCSNENKGSKNDNSQNPDTEQVSSNIPSIWHETKRKLLEQRQKRQQAKAEAVETLSTEPIQQYWQQLYGQ